jgi:hypothetical protein
VFVASGTQHAMRMRHIAGSNIFFPIISYKARFSEKKKLLNIIFLFIFSTNFVSNISHTKKNWGIYDLKNDINPMQSTRYSCQILIKPEFSRRIFEKYTKFHENPSSGSRVVPCGRTDGQTDMTKLIVAFRNFANASKN